MHAIPVTVDNNGPWSPTSSPPRYMTLFPPILRPGSIVKYAGWRVDCECVFELKGPVNSERPQDLWYVTPVATCPDHRLGTHGGYYVAAASALVPDPLASVLNEHFEY